MTAEHEKNAELGNFQQDPSGLWHYNYRRHRMGYVWNAVDDALKCRPEAAAWFWFNDTPCPMLPSDDRQTLLARWEEWREAYHRDRRSFLYLLIAMSMGE